ncbi:MAG: 30S ribosomal protein S4 [Candidatus Latescibacteria bacterium]|nr:30S ribosomal protein S4 [Candidatus Latescibacterota bacterium]
MARYIEPVCRLCRQEGAKLFLKGERCFLEKCSFERRGYAPGQHGQRPKRSTSDYRIHLREKQKARRIYGILERQFRNLFKKAAIEKGVTGENFLWRLESRLDNIVYRLGFSPSKAAARQLVRHGHILVNNKKVDIPSYNVRPHDVVHVTEKSKRLDMIHAALRRAGEGRSPTWLSVDKVNLSGTVLERPSREDLPIDLKEHLIVEFYSK